MSSDAEIEIAVDRIHELLNEVHGLCIKHDMIELVRIIVPMGEDIQMIGSARIGGPKHVQAVLAAGQEGVDIANMIMEYGVESADATIEEIDVPTEPVASQE